MVFNHSVKVPTQYKKAAAIFKRALTEKISVKTVAFETKHAKLNTLLALFYKYSNNRAAIEEAIEKTKILAENTRLDPALARVLITELLFGTGKLNCPEAKPVACVLSFESKLKEVVKNTGKSPSKPKKDNKPRYVRVNTNLTSVQKVHKKLAKEEWVRKKYVANDYNEYLEAMTTLDDREYIVDIHVPTLLVFGPVWKHYWAVHELTGAKKVILQDRATCIASHLLNPPPNSVVLDMCAAPGMKTIHLSNIMNNEGIIYAVEQNPQRYELLRNILEEAQAVCVQTIKADVLTVTDEDVPDVEYILVDPSCTGSGIQNRVSLCDEVKDEDRIRKLGGLQIKILLHAMSSFPKAKRIVYSTCSLYEEENEHVVQRCLELCKNFKLLNGKKCLDRKWNNVGDINYKGIGKNCLYSLPDKDLTEGLFMAVFERVRNE